VCTIAGPPTHSTRWPAALTSRTRCAICRTSSACGFSLDTDEDMKPNPSLASSSPVAGSSTRTPVAPQTTSSPARTSDTGTVRISVPATTRPQSISGRSTGCHCPSSRTRVSRLVVE
jgi:hypothetical protein